MVADGPPSRLLVCPLSRKWATAVNGDIREEGWTRCSFVQFIIADDDDIDHIRRNEPGGPNVGGLDGPDRPPPPSPPRTPVKHEMTADDSDRPMDSDTSPSDPISHDPSSTSSDTSRSRSGRRHSRRNSPSLDAPRDSSPRRARPSSLPSRGGIVKRRIS